MTHGFQTRVKPLDLPYTVKNRSGNHLNVECGHMDTYMHICTYVCVKLQSGWLDFNAAEISRPNSLLYMAVNIFCCASPPYMSASVFSSISTFIVIYLLNFNVYFWKLNFHAHVISFLSKSMMISICDKNIKQMYLSYKVLRTNFYWYIIFQIDTNSDIINTFKAVMSYS
jgi:hypothetical protein